MANLNLDPSVLQADLTDGRTAKRILNYLYQLSEQLRWWQSHVEPDNLTAAFREQLDRTRTDAAWARKTSGELAKNADRPARALENGAVTVDADGVCVRDAHGDPAVRLHAGGAEVRALTVDGAAPEALVRGVLDACLPVSRDRPEGSGPLWIEPGEEAADAPGAYVCRVLYLPGEARP